MRYTVGNSTFNPFIRESLEMYMFIILSWLEELLHPGENLLQTSLELHTETLNTERLCTLT